MDLTRGGITRPMLLFAGPMIAGNLLQQCYNIADTLIVGRALGASALASVGFSFTLMTFLTSVLLGLCMGSGALWSMLYGAGREEELKRCLFASFVFIGAVAVLLNVGVLALLEPVMTLLRIPAGAWEETRAYLRVVLLGVCFTFLYNLSWDWAGGWPGPRGPRCSPRGCPPPVSPSTAGGGCPCSGWSGGTVRCPGGSWGAS